MVNKDDKLLNFILKRVEEEKQLSSDVNLMQVLDNFILYDLFGDLAVSALELLDHHRLVKTISSHEKFYFMIKGSSNRDYHHVFLASCLCTCPFYVHQVVNKASHSLCKHILACLLAESLGDKYYETRRLTKEEYAQYVYEKICEISFMSLV